MCRCILEYMADHNVHTFISMAGPQLGIYGTFWITIPGHPTPRISNWILSKSSAVAYRELVQKGFSGAAYWHDPINEELYISNSSGLAYLKI